MGAVLAPRWSDLDLDAARVRWRADNDKLRSAHETPLSAEAVRWLKQSRRERAHLGDGWVFPAPGRPEQTVTRHRVRTWWNRLETLAGITPEPGRGWHSLRRKFATELKHTPLRDLAQLGGWKSAQTILKCYQRAEDATLRNALATRATLTAAGLVQNERTPQTDTTAEPAQETHYPASA